MITFGPVPSRRLGKSLGVNNIFPPKSCSYSCVYCQVGKTRKKSCVREPFYKPQVVYEEVNNHLNALSNDNYPDYLTIVSNGEPTLDLNLGEIIRLLKTTGIPVAVISNASLLNYNSVREDLDQADLVSLKIDACDIFTWYLINRPVAGLNFDNIISHIILFGRNYSGTLCTETMLVRGKNDSAENISGVARIVKEVDPEKAFISVPTRPPAENNVKPAEAEKLNMAWLTFNNMQITAEILAGFEGTDTGFTGNIYEDILNITAVHPLREDALLKLLQNEGTDYTVVNSMINQHLIRSVIYEGNRYYIRDYHPVI